MKLRSDEQIKALILSRMLTEYGVWVQRNANRAALRAFYTAYQERCGEYFNSTTAEPDEIDEHTRLRESLEASQRALTSARGATRRAIKALANATGVSA